MNNFKTKKNLVPILVCITILSSLFLTACSSNEADKSRPIIPNAQVSPTVSTSSYATISPKDARDLMAKDKSVILVDVRTLEEYNEGHIPNSILIPNEVISTEASKKLTDKNQTIIVYCRSGRRSALAANELISQGYTNVLDLGGIQDWPYEIVK